MNDTTYSIQAGDFKAKCLKLMDDVNEKHITITITKHGRPVAKLMPIEEKPVDFFGCMKDTVTIKGDIVSSVDIAWDAEK